MVPVPSVDKIAFVFRPTSRSTFRVVDLDGNVLSCTKAAMVAAFTNAGIWVIYKIDAHGVPLRVP